MVAALEAADYKATMLISIETLHPPDPLDMDAAVMSGRRMHMKLPTDFAPSSGMSRNHWVYLAANSAGRYTQSFAPRGG